MTALAVINRDSILERVAQGEMLDKIANDLGIAAPNISKHLAKDPEYKLAREIGAELRLHRALSAVQEIAELGIDKDSGEIVGISQQLGNLARVRESTLKAAQWFAEREFPERWAGKQDQSSSGVTIVINTQDSTGRIIDMGGVQEAGGGVLEGNPSCMPSSTDLEVITQSSK